jgi:hypothetical protein
MKTAVGPAPASRDEINRRLADYRRVGFERRLPAVIVYLPEQHPCPWGDCDALIAGIDFQLDRLADAAQRENWLSAWWRGSGLVGRCPRCKRFVLFGYQSKRALDDPAAFADALLPETWDEIAILAPKLQG